ncbi:variant surface glycoprotein (VSG), putative [Trypanosoma equiperdum]|uniref:Variant surface glycoprotein (VSG), putative n=1 Tax=Trypanosoma equiperdum TaxID=5694 RepID=A0A1G4IDZ7_TRYEQ|nr:variant surface glycoprotein (VSG), putative [Trypanosoma equiperdum]
MISIRYFCLAIAVSQLAVHTNSDENAVELNIFFAIANMLKGAKLEDATATDIEQDYLTAWKEIQAIYIATSSETFYDKGPVVGEKDQPTGKGKTMEYDPHWASTTRKELTNLKVAGPEGKEVDKYTRKHRTDFPEETAHKLDRLYSIVTNIHAATATTQQTITAQQTTIAKQTHEALYGTERAVTGAPTDTHGTYTFQSAYNTACGSSASAAGATLGSDMVCLCSVAASSQSAKLGAKICNSTDTTFTAIALDYSGKSAAGTALTAILGLCSRKGKRPALYVANIDNLLAIFRSTLGRYKGSANDGFTYRYGKGKDSSGQCSGAHETSDVCINYAAVLAGGRSKSTPLEAIKWVQKLLSARSFLTSRRALEAKKLQQQSRLISLAGVMETLYTEALYSRCHATPEAPRKHVEIFNAEKKNARNTKRTKLRAKMLSANGRGTPIRMDHAK